MGYFELHKLDEMYDHYFVVASPLISNKKIGFADGFFDSPDNDILESESESLLNILYKKTYWNS